MQPGLIVLTILTQDQPLVCYSNPIKVLCCGTGKQNNVTLSSCESEVISSKTTCQQGIWVRGLYTDLGATFTKPTNIMQDNTGAIAMAKTDANNSRSRHYRVACAYIRECLIQS